MLTQKYMLALDSQFRPPLLSHLPPPRPAPPLLPCHPLPSAGPPSNTPSRVTLCHNPCNPPFRVIPYSPLHLPPPMASLPLPGHPLLPPKAPLPLLRYPHPPPQPPSHSCATPSRPPGPPPCCPPSQVTSAEGFGKTRLFEILDDLESKSRPIMKAARKALAEAKGESALEPWNMGYALAGETEKALDPYFPFGGCGVWAARGRCGKRGKCGN